MAHPVKQLLFKQALIAACFIGTAWSAALAQGGSLTLPAQPGGAVELVLDDYLVRDPSVVLQVFVGDAAVCCAGKTPIVGQYHFDGQRVIFDPVFDFIEGQSYTVMSSAAAPEPILTTFIIEPDDGVLVPKVIAIYPSGPDIPENTLRFYIEFSTPMKPHVSMDFISLVDADGTPDTAAFMTFKQELWNEDRTRLTLLMDPGRIKRGVATNMELGPALIAGNRYAIRIEGGWQAARGVDTAPSFEHIFTVSDALRTRPDPDLWQFEEPRLSTRDPLLITFDRPFDKQMLQDAITVVDANGQVFAGAVSVGDAERTWRFVPQDVWSTQTLSIVVDAYLEDVAGNNFRELLDHSLGTNIRAVDHQTVRLLLGPSPN